MSADNWKGRGLLALERWLESLVAFDELVGRERAVLHESHDSVMYAGLTEEWRWTVLATKLVRRTRTPRRSGHSPPTDEPEVLSRRSGDHDQAGSHPWEPWKNWA